RKLRELRKFTFCVRRQWNADGCERLVVAGLQVREPAEGIDDLGIDLVGVVGRLTEQRLGRPRIEEAAIDAVRVAGKTARQQVRLETADDADEQVRQYHRRAAETFHGEGVAV